MVNRMATKVKGRYEGRPCYIAGSRPLCQEFITSSCRSVRVITVQFLDYQPGKVNSMSVLDEVFRKNFKSGLEDVYAEFYEDVDTKAETAILTKPEDKC